MERPSKNGSEVFYNFVSHPANRQTHKVKNMTSADVTVDWVFVEDKLSKNHFNVFL